MEHKLSHYPKASTLYKRFHIWGALVLMVCKGPPLSYITLNKRFYYICKSKLSAFVRHFKKWNTNRIENGILAPIDILFIKMPNVIFSHDTLWVPILLGY
jgi:hypothetical protein